MKIMIVAMILAVASTCSSASAQLGFIPMPPPTPLQQDPCAMLQQQINIASAGLNGWSTILADRRNKLRNAQARLAEVQSWRELFWDGVDQQRTPLSEGQIMSIGMINTEIISSQIHVAQTQTHVIQAEQQVSAWIAMLKNAHAAFNAAGCR